MKPSKFFEKWFRLADLFRGVEQKADFRKAFDKGREYEKKHGGGDRRMWYATRP